MKFRSLIFKLLVLTLFFGLFLFGRTNEAYANAENTLEKEFQFYHTHEEDLDIDVEHTLHGFSELFFEKEEKNVFLTIPETVKKISESAFTGCYELIVVELPSVLPEIEAGAFLNCNRILEVYDGSGTIVDPQLASLQYGGLFYHALSFRQKGERSNLTIELDGQVFCEANRGIYNGQNFFVGYLGNNSDLVLHEKSFSYNIYSYALWKNDTVVSVNASYSHAISIGAYSFYSCSNLRYVTLPNELKEIGTSAFQNSNQLLVAELMEENTLPKSLQNIGSFAFKDTSLNGKIKVPASVERIGEEAFFNCSIENLIFEESVKESSKKLTIEKNAFRNCTRLSVIELPTRLHMLYPYAFSSTGVTTVYIHSTIEFMGDSLSTESISYFPNTATIIFDSKEAYSVSKEDVHLIEHVSQMTYRIPIVFSDGTHTFELERLANRNFDVIKGGEGTWSKISDDLRNSLLPTQKGYVFSVWHSIDEHMNLYSFSTKNEKTIEEAIQTISNILQNALRDNIVQIEFYAEFIEKPIVEGKTLVYNETISYNNPEEWASLLQNQEGKPIYDSRYMNVFLDDGKECISDAGNYRLRIQLKEEFGMWDQEGIVPITVQRKMIYLNHEISWSADIEGNHTDLLSGTVYIYKNAFGDSQYAYSPLKPEQIKKGYSFYSVMSVANSIVRARNFEVYVELNENAFFETFYSGSNFTFDGNMESIGQNWGLENNVYTAKAIIKANPNYSFRSLGDVDSITNSSRGLTIDISNDRTEARITKVWFILDVSNGIFCKDTKEEFSIPSWKYNSDVSLPFPKLEYVQATDNFTYSLIKDGILLVEEALVEKETRDLTYYINSSMPVGDYTLTLHVPDVEVDGVHYFGYDAPFSFKVTPDDFKEDWKEDAVSKLSHTEWQYIESNKEAIVQVYHHSSYNDNYIESINDHSVPLKIWSDFESVSLNPKRQGYWATIEADGYYSSRFALTYNLDRMQLNRYYTYEELQNSSSIFVPKQVGDYKVYYQLQAKNYTPLVDSKDDLARREYYFDVTIFDYILKPTLSNFKYTGLEIKPQINYSSYFTISYDDEEYQSAGVHSITLTSIDSLHYRWNKNSLEESIAIEFEILAAENEWIRSPNMLSWEYGNFSINNTLILAEAKYGTEIVFSIALDENGEHKIAGLEEFFIVDGLIQDEEILEVLKTLPATTDKEPYYLISKIKETKNYNALQGSTRFQVFKTKNTWKTTPNVVSWKFGDYDKTIHLILAEANLKDENNPVLFTISYDQNGNNPVAGLENFTAINGIVGDEQAKILSELKVNTYYLFARVNETQSYAGLHPEPYAFKVSIASNYWEIAPKIVSWTEGKYNKEDHQIVFDSHFGEDVHIIITSVENKEKIIYDNKNNINDLASAKCGVYELRAYVNATDDYEELTYTMAFQIFEKPGIPWWGGLLIVVGTLALVFLVFFLLHQSGVLQILSGKFIIAMRTKATVDATIAAVRANKIAEESKWSMSASKLKDADGNKKTTKISEQNPLKNDRIKVNENHTKKFQKKATQMQRKAEKMIQKSDKKRKSKF